MPYYIIEFKSEPTTSIKFPNQTLNALRNRGKVYAEIEDRRYSWIPSSTEDHTRFVERLSDSRAISVTLIEPTPIRKSRNFSAR